MNQSIPTIKHFAAQCSIYSAQDTLVFWQDIGESLCQELGLVIVKTFEQEFEPQGKTILFVLSTSHLAIHTWPENNFVHFDLLTCKEIAKKEFDEALNKVLSEQKIERLETAEYFL